VQAAGMGARRPSIRSTTPRYPVVWSPGPCRVGRARAARGREAEPAGRRSRSKARTYDCPERRGPRCSERSRRCCFGHRPHLGAEAAPAGPGRSTARSRTSPSRPGPPTRTSTGAWQPSRAVWVCAAYSSYPQNRSYSNRRYSNRRYLPSIGDPRPGGRPPSEGAGSRRSGKGSHHKPVPRGPRRRV
jgi:hypothetical protein